MCTHKMTKHDQQICLYDRKPLPLALPPRAEPTPAPPCGGDGGERGQNYCISFCFPHVVKSVLPLEKCSSPKLPCFQSQNQWFSFNFLTICKSGWIIDASALLRL